MFFVDSPYTSAYSGWSQLCAWYFSPKGPGFPVYYAMLASAPLARVFRNALTY